MGKQTNKNKKHLRKTVAKKKVTKKRYKKKNDKKKKKRSINRKKNLPDAQISGCRDFLPGILVGGDRGDFWFFESGSWTAKQGVHGHREP